MLYRQGDVLLRKVSARPKGKMKPVERDNGKIVLAYGEVTGHAHVVVEEGESLLSMDESNRLWLEIVGPASLKHGNLSDPALKGGDHDEIPLPPGTYEVTHQQEYAPGEIRKVID